MALFFLSASPTVIRLARTLDAQPAEIQRAHVVARVSWLGIDKKKLVEEGALVAAILAETAPIIKTIALRGVDPGAADPNADDAGWFDAKISRLNAARIEKAKIWEYATTRYKRLFDGIVER